MLGIFGWWWVYFEWWWVMVVVGNGEYILGGVGSRRVYFG